MDMSVLGISADEEEIYRYFLRHPGDGVDALRQAFEWDPDTIEAAVDILSRLTLLDITDRHRILATDPRVGFERIIEQRLHDLNSEIRKVLAARESITSFLEDRQHGENRAPALDIERVEGLDKVRQRIDDLAFFSYRETLALHPGKPLSSAAIESALPLDTRSLRRGLTVKGVYHPKALDEPAMGTYLRDIARLGAEIRITAEPMDRMVIFDRGMAVVPIDPKDSSRGALLVREPGLVSQIVAYFDSVWQSAGELQDHIGHDETSPALSALEKRVLTALARYDKDEIAAREIDVSVRTYRRYVADLMSRLGAANRFQAALRAKEENWI